MKSTVDFQMPRGSLVILITLGLILLASAFMVGRVLEQRHQRAVIDEVTQQAQVLEPLRNAPANSALVAPLQALDPAHFPAIHQAGADPRRPGLNYFRLFQVPSRYKTDAERVVAFLAEHKVDAAVLSIQNGDLYKVIALPGFERISDPQAQAFEKQLRLLGRMWKQQRKGSTDWQDLYPEKFLPGRN